MAQISYVIEGQVAVTSGSKGSVSHRNGIHPVPITVCPLSFVKLNVSPSTKRALISKYLTTFKGPKISSVIEGKVAVTSAAVAKAASVTAAASVLYLRFVQYIRYKNQAQGQVTVTSGREGSVGHRRGIWNRYLLLLCIQGHTYRRTGAAVTSNTKGRISPSTCQLNFFKIY